MASSSRSQTYQFIRGDTFHPPKDRDNIFIDTTHCFHMSVRKYVNGLINAQGGVIYFGIRENGKIDGFYLSRAAEDDYRLQIDNTIGSFIPFVPPSSYRVIFHPVRCSYSGYKIIEIKVSAGSLGEIYEDGIRKLYLYANNELLGPLWPQEIQQLVIQKYHENLKAIEGLKNFTTPAIDRNKKERKDKENLELRY